MKYKFVWTDSEDSLKQRHILGVTWDELPALAINSMDRNDFAYPRDLPFEKENINKWLTDTLAEKKGLTSENSLV